MNVSLLLGDCIVRMSEMDAGTIEAVVCDPPYGINFMGEAWDGKFHVEIPAGIAVSGTGIDFKAGKTGKAHSHGLANHDGRKFQQWSAAWLTEVYRVLQPGGTLLSFGGTRTFHRLGAAMADVGFTNIHHEAWNYANGFPKSLNVGKSFDRRAGELAPENTRFSVAGVVPGQVMQGTAPSRGYVPPVPVTLEAVTWDGWGTALKPAWEPVLVGVKP